MRPIFGRVGAGSCVSRIMESTAINYALQSGRRKHDKKAQGPLCARRTVAISIVPSRLLVRLDNG